MARQPKQDNDTTLEVLDRSALEPMPEIAGTMTDAAADAAPRDPVNKGDAKALSLPVKDQGEVKWYRVMNDRAIMGATGFRARMKAGKEISTAMYNVDKLRQQGVQLEEITEQQRVQ